MFKTKFFKFLLMVVFLTAFATATIITTDYIGINSLTQIGEGLTIFNKSFSMINETGESIFNISETGNLFLNGGDAVFSGSLICDFVDYSLEIKPENLENHARIYLNSQGGSDKNAYLYFQHNNTNEYQIDFDTSALRLEFRNSTGFLTTIFYENGNAFLL